MQTVQQLTGAFTGGSPPSAGTYPAGAAGGPKTIGPEGGPKAGGLGGGEGPRSQVGGLTNYAVTAFWFFIGWAGWCVTLASLAAAQSYVNKRGGQDVSEISPEAAWPRLSAGKFYRFIWFILFFDFVILIVVCIIVGTAALRHSRLLVIGWLAVASVLTIIACNDMYNFQSFFNGADHTANRAAFAGFVILSIAFLALIYMLGISPDREGF